MGYPYVKMLNIHKEQIVMEICCLETNYRVVIKNDYLFDGKIIYAQKYKKTEGQKLLSIYELHKFNYIDFQTNMKLFNKLNE